jgi:hypothetical protein
VGGSNQNALRDGNESEASGEGINANAVELLTVSCGMVKIDLPFKKLGEEIANIWHRHSTLETTSP